MLQTDECRSLLGALFLIGSIAMAPTTLAADGVTIMHATRAGFVDVVGTVGPDGSVIEAHVQRSEPPGTFDKAALRAIKTWKFRPKVVDGVAVNRPFEQRLVFGNGDMPPSDPASPDGATQPAPLAGDEVIPLERVAPEYPYYALTHALSGWVRVVGVVDEKGNVRSARAAGSNPKGIFDTAAVTAIKRWRFKPRTVDGTPVAREFEQYINFDITGDPNTKLWDDFIVKHGADAEALYLALRAMCPDRYAHADDAVNEALRSTLGHQGPPPSLSDNLAAARFQLQQAEPCLFSTWEQIKDPQAYELSARLAEFDLRRKSAEDSAAALRAVGGSYQQPPSAAPPSPQQRSLIRSWMFVRLSDVYFELVHAQARLLVPAAPRSAETSNVLDRANAALALNKPKEARSILVKALKRDAGGVDGALMQMALARVEVLLHDPDSAVIILAQVTAMPDLPWNVRQSALIAQASLCGRAANYACFDSALAEVTRELGVDDRLSY